MLKSVERAAISRFDRWAIEGATRVLLRWLKRADARMVRVDFNDADVVMTLAVGERAKQLDAAFAGLRKAIGEREAA